MSNSAGSAAEMGGVDDPGGTVGGVPEDGGGVAGGVPEVGGGVPGPPGVPGPDPPGDDGVPPPPTVNGTPGKKNPSGGAPGTGATGGVSMEVIGGGATGNSTGDSLFASSTAGLAASIASVAGSVLETGATGASDKRLPQRVRAMCVPSLKTVSPAGISTAFLVQKILFPIRYET